MPPLSNIALISLWEISPPSLELGCEAVIRVFSSSGSQGGEGKPKLG